MSWDIGLVTLSVVDDDGFLGLQVDHYGEKNAAGQAGDVVGAYGLLARPHDPDVDADGLPDAERACRAAYVWYGDRLHVVPFADPRVLAKLPAQKKGGSILYGGKLARPGFVELDGGTGSLTQYVPYAFDGDGNDATPTKACVIAIDVRTPDAESISIVHGAGMALTMAAGGKKSSILKNAAGDAYFELNDDGHTLNGRVSLGAPEGATAVALAAGVLEALAVLKAAVLAAGAGANAAATASALTPLTAALEKVAAKLVKAT